MLLSSANTASGEKLDRLSAALNVSLSALMFDPDDTKDSREAALSVLAEIYRIVNALKTQPNTGRPGRVSGTRKIYISGTSYIIPYRIIRNEIQILRVLHTAKQ